MKTPADYLRAAAELISQPGAWTQHAYARTKIGEDVNSNHPEATCFCMLGAVHRVSDETPAAALAFDYLYLAVDKGDGVTGFNDANDRTQSEVIEAFNRAIELSEAAA